ncbi:hypothetical protein [Nonomuraea sp. NPDC052265]|uniref:hypothetical protein n=1 Tax=Nonomuraea sp. NPDC052265 TaxID=3364374 RepID=UPI0037C79E90
MSWIVPHALSDGARDHMIRVTGAATTALLGRKNYEGFGSFWSLTDLSTTDSGAICLLYDRVRQG